MAALETMAALAEYMNPDYLTHDSNATFDQMDGGQRSPDEHVGIAHPGADGTRGFGRPRCITNTRVGGPLMVGDSGVPATTLWWDGFTVSSNASDADAEATFRALVHAIQPDLLTDETQQMAVWMIEGYEPTPVSAGVLDTINAGAQPYPMLPLHGPAAHRAGGDNIAAYLQDRVPPRKPSRRSRLPIPRRRERGFLN